jgi:hypothetical protein
VRTINLTAQQIKKIAIAIAAIVLASAATWCAWKISTFNSLSESDAKWWVQASEWLLIGSTVLLTAGLFGEWSDSESWKKRFLYTVAKAAVIVGVVGELLGDGGIFRAGDRVQELDNAKIIALEIRLAPRHLPDDKKAQFIDRMKPFSGQRFTMSAAGAAEAVRFAIEIGDTLTSAGLVWINWPLGPWAIQPPRNWIGHDGWY